MRKLAKQQAIIWFALIGVLFGTLAPAISHAMARSHSVVIEMPICSSAGMTTMIVDMGGRGAPAGDDAAHMFEHCPYCSQGNHVPGLLPAAQPALPAPSLADGYPPRFYQSTTALFPWTAASARAPPAAT